MNKMELTFAIIFGSIISGIGGGLIGVGFYKSGISLAVIGILSAIPFAYFRERKGHTA